MKTSTLLIAAGTVGALILLAKSRKAGMGDGDMLLPPPGLTVTASGQVLGDLGSRVGMMSNIRKPDKAAAAAAAAAYAASEARFQALQKQVDAQAIAARAAAQEQVNITLAAIQKQADEEMARQAKAEQERQAKVEQERQAKVEQERQSAIQARAAAMQQEDAALLAQREQEQSNYDAAKAAFEVHMQTQPQSQQKPVGNSKAGLLVGGGVLAAIAAAMAS
jgi:hypothetical protein